MGRQPAITGIDHVMVGVSDLELARARWRRLGFLPSPRGRHIGWGTANYCLMFHSGYVALLGIVDPEQFTNDLDSFLDRREGLLGLAFASDDPAGTAAQLRAQGIAAGAPRDLARAIETPNGELRPAFKLLDLPASATPGLSAFVIHHVTPELVWQPAWCRHPNGARGLVAITTVVADPSATAIPYGELFGFDQVWVQDGSVEVDTGRGRLLFVTPAALPQLHPGLGHYPAHPAPWCAAIRIAVEHLEATAYYFAQSTVGVLRARPDRLTVAPAEANGVILEFVQEETGSA